MTRAGLWIFAVFLGAIAGVRIATVKVSHYDARLMKPELVKPAVLDGL